MNRARQSFGRTDVTGANDTGEKYPHKELVESLDQTSQNLHEPSSGTYPGNILTCLSVGNQKVDRIARGLGVPPVLDVCVKHGVQFCGSLRLCLPRRTGKPTQEQGGGGSASLNGHQQLSDPLEIGSVVCQVATCEYTGGHDEDQLKRTSSALVLKVRAVKKTHVEDIGEWIDSTIVPPPLSLAGDILHQCRENLNAIRPILEIIDCMTDTTRTVLSAGLVQKHAHSLYAEGPFHFLNLFR